MKYFVDSSAWIEYFNGSSIGEKVSKVLNSDNEIFILSINIGEVISFLKREDKNFHIAYESMIKRSKIFDITPKIAKDSGLLHAEKKKSGSGFSLADSMILNSARSIGARVLTKDPHFKDFKEAIML